MITRVCISGVTGGIGKPLALAVSQTDDLRLVGAISRSRKGHSTKEVTGDPSVDVTISGSVADALKTPTDVMVDYTKSFSVPSPSGSRSVTTAAGVTNPTSRGHSSESAKCAIWWGWFAGSTG